MREASTGGAVDLLGDLLCGWHEHLGRHADFSARRGMRVLPASRHSSSTGSRYRLLNDTTLPRSNDDCAVGPGAISPMI